MPQNGTPERRNYNSDRMFLYHSLRKNVVYLPSICGCYSSNFNFVPVICLIYAVVCTKTSYKIKNELVPGTAERISFSVLGDRQNNFYLVSKFHTTKIPS